MAVSVELGVVAGVEVGASLAAGVTVSVNLAVTAVVDMSVTVEVAFPVRKIFAPPPSLSVSARSTVLGRLTISLFRTIEYVSGPSSAIGAVGEIANVPVPSGFTV